MEYIANLKENDKIYLIDRDNVLEAEIIEINKLYTVKNENYVDVTCKVYIPGLRTIIRFYTLTDKTINKDWFLGSTDIDVVKNTIKMTKDEAILLVRETARTDAILNFEHGHQTTPDFHRSILHEFYNTEEEITEYIKVYYQVIDQLTEEKNRGNI
jgi:hypothetical protein